MFFIGKFTFPFSVCAGVGADKVKVLGTTEHRAVAQYHDAVSATINAVPRFRAIDVKAVPDHGCLGGTKPVSFAFFLWNPKPAIQERLFPNLAGKMSHLQCTRCQSASVDPNQQAGSGDHCARFVGYPTVWSLIYPFGITPPLPRPCHAPAAALPGASSAASTKWQGPEIKSGPGRSERRAACLGKFRSATRSSRNTALTNASKIGPDAPARSSTGPALGPRGRSGAMAHPYG